MDVLVKVPTHVALGDIILRLPVVAEEASAERRVGGDRDAQLLAGIEDAVLLDFGREGRVLELDSGDGTNGGRAADGVGGSSARSANLVSFYCPV